METREQSRRERWQTSPLRESLLNWYEFRPGSSLLEIGCEAQDLTELFIRRCREVSTVIAEDEEAKQASLKYQNQPAWHLLKAIPAPGEKTFDYIVIMNLSGQKDEATDLLRSCREILSPGGILLLSAENRYGLKYFCGSPDPCTGIPFMGINGYHERLMSAPEKGRLYSRAEWEEILKRAGFPHWQFYYPVPDSRMPQFIFSDRYQNSTNVSERLNDYNYASPGLFGLLHRILPDMIASGALPFMADSFLIEVTGDGRLSDIDYAVVTTDRGPHRGAATSVRRNGQVIKRPLWPEGEEYLRHIFSLQEELAQKGVPMVKADLCQDEAGWHIAMPFIKKESLTPVLERAAEEEPQRFLRIFDNIYEAICRSAGQEAAKGAAGTRVFLDLAPCNCFYDGGEDDHLLFYDQEFVSDNASPSFAMFRTIKYFFASSPRARKAWKEEELYLRYGITPAMREAFETQEKAFIRSVRSLDENRWLIKDATPDYERIGANMRRMKADPPKPYHIGYVPGVFDLFHTGHLRLIERCKERCDHLIVGVLTDELVTYYKGKPPVISCENRMAVIRGLRAVDEVIEVNFENTDKLAAWEMLHYDCHFSGDDHVSHWNDVLLELRKRGSNMEFFSYTKGISSTSIKAKIEEDL